MLGGNFIHLAAYVPEYMQAKNTLGGKKKWVERQADDSFFIRAYFIYTAINHRVLHIIRLL
jgi:hypothetical protein